MSMKHIILITLLFSLNFLNNIFAQDIIVKGRVTEANGEPIPGVAVIEGKSKNSAVTNSDGEYSIKAGSNSKLTYTCLGYIEKSIEVSGRNEINVRMQVDAIGLNEIIVTAYGKTVTKDKLTASISKVSSDILQSGVRSEPLSALYGSVTGVRVSTTSGQPGTAPSILIRGGTSLSGTGTPLFIIDGMQRGDMQDVNPNDIESIEILKDAAATALYGARASNGVVMVTTKSGRTGKARIEVKSTLGYNFLRNTYDFLDAKDYLYWLRLGAYNAGQEALLSQANGFGTGNVYLADGNKDARGVWSTMFLTPENRFLLDYGYKTMVDPVTGRELIYNEFSAKEGSIKNVSTTQEYNVSVSGGNDRGKYYSSLGWYDEKGFPLSTWYNRISFNFSAAYKINKWLSTNARVTFSESGKRSVEDLRREEEFFGIMFSAPPTMRKYNIDGDLIVGHNYQTGNWSATIDKFYRRTTSYRLTLGNEYRIDFNKNLYLKLSGQWYMTLREFESFNKEFRTSSTAVDSKRNTAVSYTRNLNQTYNALLVYDNSWAEHNLNIQSGFEYYRKMNFNIGVSGQGASSDDFISLKYMKIDPATTKTNSIHTEERMMSAFSNISYDYKGKYLLSFSGRLDGYSKLINNRWGFFPGISAAWNIYKEGFIQKYDFISSLKLRAGYGQNGNVNIVAGPYDLQGDYGNTPNYNTLYGILIDSLPYPDLRWEKTTSFDLALEGSLWNRLSFSIGGFNKLTTDLLASVPFPSSSGVGVQYTNNGSVRSRGIELEFGYSLLKNKTWDIHFGANLTYLRSKIISLPYNGNERNRQGGQEVYDPNTGELVWVRGYQEGLEYGDSYAYQLMHVVRDEEDLQNYAWYVDTFPTKNIYGPAAWAALTPDQQLNAQPLRPGDAIWLDVNKDNKIDVHDQVRMGTVVPRWMGGMNIKVKYKNLGLLARFDYTGGHVEFNSRLRYYLGALQGTFNTVQEVKDTWLPSNPDAKYPIFLYGQGGRSNYRQANFLYDRQDYLCGREISLTYDLPNKFANKIKMQSLQCAVTGQNLFYITRSRFYTPEYGADTNSGYPTPRTVLLSLKMTF